MFPFVIGLNQHPMSTASLSISNLEHNGLKMPQGMVGPIPSWVGLAWLTNVDSCIRSLYEVIVIYFTTFWDKWKNSRMVPYIFWDFQVIVIWNFLVNYSYTWIWSSNFIVNYSCSLKCIDFFLVNYKFLGSCPKSRLCHLQSDYLSKHLSSMTIFHHKLCP